MIILVSFVIYTQHIASNQPEKEIMVYAPPVLEPIIRDFSILFEKKYNIKVLIIIGPTGTLINKVEVSKEGDVLMTADHIYMEKAIQKGFVKQHSTRVISYLIPVLVISRSKNLSISNIEDLASHHVKIAVPDPDVAPFGRIAIEILIKSGIYFRVKDNIYYFPDTLTASRQVALGVIDVGILPHVVKYWYPEDLDIVWFEPSVIGTSATCQLIAVLEFSNQPEVAFTYILELLKYLSSLNVEESGYIHRLEDFKKIAPYDYTQLDLPMICRAG